MSKLLLSFAIVSLTTYNSLLVMEQLGKFTLSESIHADLANDIYPTKKYVDETNNYYVQVSQTFPMIFTTNFFIKAEEKSKQGFPSHVTVTYVETDTNALSLLMNSFLGKIEKNECDLPGYYTVQKNLNKQKETIIECCEHAKRVFCMPSFERYRCFSRECRLLATYSTSFYSSLGFGNDDRHKVLLRHLDNIKKERTININDQFEVESVFLENTYLIVGSSLYSNFYKYCVDIYDAKVFFNNVGDNKDEDVSHYLRLEILENKTEQAEIQDSIFKLMTVEKDCLFLQNQITKQYIFLNYADRVNRIEQQGTAFIGYFFNQM